MDAPQAWRVEPLHARPRSDAELATLFSGGWPAFIGADALAEQHLPEVRRRFADLEVVLLVDDVVVAAAWGVPVRWDGSLGDLPAGYGDALGRALAGERGDRPDTLVVCAAQVRPDAAGSGLAARVLSGLVDGGPRRD